MNLTITLMLLSVTTHKLFKHLFWLVLYELLSMWQSYSNFQPVSEVVDLFGSIF